MYSSDYSIAPSFLNRTSNLGGIWNNNDLRGSYYYEAPLPARRFQMSEMDFQRLVDQQYAALYRFAFSLAKSEADAADLTQQTFFLWASKGEQLRDRTKSWLFTTLYREFLNRHRHEVRFPKVELHDAPEEAVSIMPNMDAFDGASITKALREVEEPFRAALTLFYLEQFS